MPSAIHTDTPGRVDKTSVINALQAKGESYDRVRETLKHVSVDASGKVELEDWVEVCRFYEGVLIDWLIFSQIARYQTKEGVSCVCLTDEEREGHRSWLECKCQSYHQ